MSISECLHVPSARVINEDDFVVCSNCALVLNEFARLEYGTPIWNQNNEWGSVIDSDVNNCYEQIILNICQEMDLSSVIASEAINIFTYHLKQECAKKISKAFVHELTAACIYLSCEKAQVPRMLSEVCQYVNATEQKTWKLLVRLGKDLNMVSADHILTRFSGYLNLNYKMQREIQDIIIHLPLKFESLNPRTVCALCTIIYIEQKELTSELCNRQSICKLYNVSLGNIRRYLKVLHPLIALPRESRK